MQPGLAIVTGAGSGIGRAIANRLAADGHAIAVLDIDLPSAQKVAQEIIGNAGRAAGFKCDVSRETEVNSAVEAARAQFGLVRILVNAAGVATNPGLPFTNNTEADWDRTLNVNLKSVFFLSKAVTEDLKQAGDGRIVNISSITGVINAPYMPPYSVSKAAINSLTKVMARDLAPHGVAVNAVCPGFVWTGMWDELGRKMAEASKGEQGANPQEVFAQRIRTLVPMQREQTAEEIADTVAFLCSRSARNITGQIISVDGGVTI